MEKAPGVIIDQAMAGCVVGHPLEFLEGIPDVRVQMSPTKIFSQETQRIIS